MKKAIVAAIAVAFCVSTAAEARGGRGFSGGRSFSRPAEAHDRCEEEHDRHQPDGESSAGIYQQWLLVYCCWIVRGIDGRQRRLRCCDW